MSVSPTKPTRKSETIRYEGYRSAGGAGAGLVWRVRMEQNRTDPKRPGKYTRDLLPVRRDIRDHSPDGFQWGYGGSGPAQLALAILADALQNDRRAEELHQAFKFRVIGGLTADVWTLSREEVLATVAELEAEAAEPVSVEEVPA